MKTFCKISPWFPGLLLVSSLSALPLRSSAAGEESFSSPEAAVRALSAAAVHRDTNAMPAIYQINGRMLAGFALVAWPAQWANTGVMPSSSTSGGRCASATSARTPPVSPPPWPDTIPTPNGPPCPERVSSRVGDLPSLRSYRKASRRSGP